METAKEVMFTPAFYIAITVLAVIIGHIVESRVKNPVVNRFLIALALLLAFVVFTDTSYEEYMTGGSYITIFMGPATVALALPLYSQVKMLIKYKFVVLISIFCGSVICFASVFVTVKLLGLGSEIFLSTLPKSVTMPVALMLSRTVGGVEALTMLSVTIAGIMGAAVLPVVARLLRITDKAALGIALGTSSHVIGTTRAFELGEIEGTFSSLAIGVTAVMTVIIVPILVKFAAV